MIRDLSGKSIRLFLPSPSENPDSYREEMRMYSAVKALSFGEGLGEVAVGDRTF
jgi:hypothetical protein